MGVDAIILGAVSVQKTIAGVQTTFENVPTSLNQLPAFVTYPGDGQLEWPRPVLKRRIEHDLNMDLYVQKGGDLPAADRLLKPFIDQVIETFDQNITLGGSCFNSGVTSYKYGVISFAGVDYLGIKFTLKAIEMKQVVYKG